MSDALPPKPPVEPKQVLLQYVPGAILLLSATVVTVALTLLAPVDARTARVFAIGCVIFLAALFLFNVLVLWRIAKELRDLRVEHELVKKELAATQDQVRNLRKSRVRDRKRIAAQEESNSKLKKDSKDLARRLEAVEKLLDHLPVTPDVLHAGADLHYHLKAEDGKHLALKHIDFIPLKDDLNRVFESGESAQADGQFEKVELRCLARIEDRWETVKAKGGPRWLDTPGPTGWMLRLENPMIPEQLHRKQTIRRGAGLFPAKEEWISTRIWVRHPTTIALTADASLRLTDPEIWRYRPNHDPERVKLSFETVGKYKFVAVRIAEPHIGESYVLHWSNPDGEEPTSPSPRDNGTIVVEPEGVFVEVLKGLPLTTGILETLEAG